MSTGPNLKEHGQALWERLVKSAKGAQRQAEADPVRFKMSPMDMGVLTAAMQIEEMRGDHEKVVTAKRFFDQFTHDELPTDILLAFYGKFGSDDEKTSGEEEPEHGEDRSGGDDDHVGNSAADGAVRAE